MKKLRMMEYLKTQWQKKITNRNVFGIVIENKEVRENILKDFGDKK